MKSFPRDPSLDLPLLGPDFISTNALMFLAHTHRMTRAKPRKPKRLAKLPAIKTKILVTATKSRLGTLQVSQGATSHTVHFDKAKFVSAGGTLLPAAFVLFLEKRKYSFEVKP